MKEYLTGQIRNIVLVSHNGAGKSTFVERLLFDTGATTRMGSVDNGTAAMDFEEEEISRQGSIATAIAPVEWNGLKFNLLDTPGYADFVGEVNSALRVTESALVFVEAVAGVEVGTELVWQYTGERNLPRILVINKMDRENVSVQRTMNSVSENLPGAFVNLQLPIGEGSSFKGVVDLISMKARLGTDDPSTSSHNPGSTRHNRMTITRFDVCSIPVFSVAWAAVSSKFIEAPVIALSAGTRASRSIVRAKKQPTCFQLTFIEYQHPCKCVLTRPLPHSVHMPTRSDQ